MNISIPSETNHSSTADAWAISERPSAGFGVGVSGADRTTTPENGRDSRERPAPLSPAKASETRGGTGNDCSVGKRGAWSPEASDGIAEGERQPEASVTGRRDGHRVRCEVIGCRRTSAPDKIDPPGSATMICAQHIRTGHPRDVLLYRRARRKLKRIAEAHRRETLEGIMSRAWHRILDAANAAQVGIR